MGLVIVVAVVLVLSALGGVLTYRSTLGRGPYGGPMRNALGIGGLLGLFLGVFVGMLTLLIVLGVRALR